MKLLGRMVLLCSVFALGACGGTDDAATDTLEGSEVEASALPGPTCPTIAQPAPGFCEDGRIVPVFEGKCLVKYTCDRGVEATALPFPSCPIIAQPAPGFCEDGQIVPVYRDKCLVSYTCVR